MANVNQMIREDRDFARSRGDRFNQDNADRARDRFNTGEYYRLTGDEIAQGLMGGQGGYTPEEIEQMRQDAEFERGRTSDEEYAGNELRDDETAGIRGNPWARAAYFDPETMDNFNRASHGRMRTSAAGIGEGMRAAARNPGLSMSERYDENSDAAIEDMTGRVRGAIDPNRIRTSEAALNRIRMTPKEEQDIITSSGITAGTGYRAALGEMDRRGRAAGVDPLGMMSMREKYMRTAAGEGADAETKARVLASSERARREGDAERMRQSGETAYTDRAVDAEQNIGGMRVGREQRREDTRLGTERDRSDRESEAARVGGAAEIDAEQFANSSERQQSQFNAGLGTDIATGIERDESARARDIALNRQGTRRENQRQRYDQSSDIGRHRAGVAQTAGNARRQGAAEGRDWIRTAYGEEGRREESNLNRQQQNYGMQGQQQQATTNAQIQQNAAPRWWERAIGAAAGVAGAVAPALTGGVGGGVGSRIKRSPAGSRAPGGAWDS